MDLVDRSEFHELVDVLVKFDNSHVLIEANYQDLVAGDSVNDGGRSPVWLIDDLLAYDVKRAIEGAGVHGRQYVPLFVFATGSNVGDLAVGRYFQRIQSVNWSTYCT